MDVYTPTKVLMEGTDSVAYCQATVQEMLADLLYKESLIWQDDLLGYEVTEKKLPILLDKTVIVCEPKCLKLNPSKCSFFLQESK